MNKFSTKFRRSRIASYIWSASVVMVFLGIVTLPSTVGNPAAMFYHCISLAAALLIAVGGKR